MLRPPLPSAGIAFVLAFFFAACGGEPAIDESAATADTAASVDTLGVFADQSIVDVLQTDDQFSAFVTALDSAALTSVFEEESPLTVFVPTNEAFSGVLSAGRDRLRDVILYHTLPEDLALADLQPGDTLTTLRGDQLVIALTDNRRTVNGVPIIDPNVRANNGKIFVVQQLLSPPAPVRYTPPPVRTAPSEPPPSVPEESPSVPEESPSVPEEPASVPEEPAEPSTPLP